MWEIERKGFIETIKQLETTGARLADLENHFGSRMMNSISIDDPNFQEGYDDIDLIEIDNALNRVVEVLRQYVIEEDEYWESQQEEES